MAQLDLFARNMWRFGAHGVVLASGANVTMRLPSGDRFAAQSTPHAALVQMVEEVAGDKALALLRRGQPAEFFYTLNGAALKVQVQPLGKTWRVELTPNGPAPVEGAKPKPSESPQTSQVSQVVVGGAGIVTIVPPAPSAAAALALGNDATLDRTAGPNQTIADRVAAPERARERAAAPMLRPAAAPNLQIAPPPPPALSPMAPVILATAPITPSPQPVRRDSSELRAIERLLRKMREAGASDLHLTTGSPPAIRVDGAIRTLDEPAMTAESVMAAMDAIAPAASRAQFAEKNDADFAYDMPGFSRFRVNLFMDRRGPASVIRVIPFEVKKPADLGLPSEVLALCELHKGLVLVTGPTGSGKSTTLASLINHINETRSDHIITIEDPIEFVHESKRCLVRQREVGRHTRSFRDALRAALREDPDVVLVGELRDLETVAMAVETAETGHLVFGTLHTSTAPSTVDRVIDQFPADRQEQIRMMLSESLRGVIAQTLCRRIGGGRVAAYEILFNTGAVANLIREGKTFQIPSVMQTGRGLGMVTLNDSLIDLVRRKIVDPREAFQRAHHKVEFRGLLQREGIKLEAAA